jgi:hypothetical protein
LLVAALVAAASEISAAEEKLGSRHHFAAYSCNHRTYNHWPRSAESAELLGLPSMLRSSFSEVATGEDQVAAKEPGAEGGGERSRASSLDGVVEQGLRTLRLSMVPPFLDWGPSELCKPVLSSVDIVNMSPDDGMTIKSISTDENQFFYGADNGFEPVSVAPHGNVSVPFLFVPQELGAVQSNVFVSTTVGDFVYKFQAVGIANAHGIEPISVQMAPGTKLKRSLPIYNPHEKDIRVLEVYTPEDAFQLQLPDTENGGHADGAGAQAKLWKVEPKERKTVIQLTFESKVQVKVVGYITIQTDLDTFVIGVDVAVIGDKLLALPGAVDFGKITEVGRSQATQVVRLLNTHQASIDCTSAVQKSGGGTVTTELLEGHHRIQPGKNIDAIKVTFSAEDDGQYNGLIAVDCVPSGGSEFTVEVPYSAEVLTGSLMYRLGTVELVVGPESGPVERMVEATNEFKTPLLIIAAFSLDPAFGVSQLAQGAVLRPGQLGNIFGVTLNVTMARQEMGRYIRHKGVVGHEILFEDVVFGAGLSTSTSPIALPAGRVFGERQWDQLEKRMAMSDDGSGDLDWHRADMPKSLIGRTRIVVVTNASVFTIPVAGYDGHLTFSPPQIDFNGMRPNLLRRRYFNVTNYNPVPINVFSFSTYPCSGRAAADGPDSKGFPGGVRVALVSIRRPVERVLISGLVAAGRVNAKNLENEQAGPDASDDVLTTLESGYSAQFVVEINSTSPDTRKCEFELLASVDLPGEGGEDKAATCKSSSAEVFKDKMNIKISSSSGEITFNPPVLKFGASFNGRLEELPLCVKSTYQSPVPVQSITSSDPRFYVLPDTPGQDNTIPANGRFCFSNVVFDPSKKKVLRWEDDAKTEGTPVRGTLTLQTNLRAKVEVGVSGSIIQPRISPNGELAFPVTQIGKESEMFVEIYNPSNFSITARLAQQMKENADAEGSRPFRLMKSLSGAGSAKVTYGHTLLLRGNERGRLGPVAYVPANAQSVSDTLMIINNLTNTETISLKGKGGTGILSFAVNATGPGFPASESKCFAGRESSSNGRESYGLGCRVKFDVKSEDLAPLLDGSYGKALSDGAESESFSIRKTFTARNSGDLPMAITQIAPRSSFLTGSAVQIEVTKGIAKRKGDEETALGGVVELQPKDEFQFELTVTADYTMAKFESIVDMTTSTGHLHVPVAVTIPRDKLGRAYHAMREAEGTTLRQGLWTVCALALIGFVCQQTYAAFMDVYDREQKALGGAGQEEVPPHQPTTTIKKPTQHTPTQKPKTSPPKPAKPSHKSKAQDDSVEIEAWKQERIRRLRDVLGKVSLKQVEHLLEEANWEEERAADLFFHEVQGKKEKVKAAQKAKSAQEAARAKQAAERKAAEERAAEEERRQRAEEKERKLKEKKEARKQAKAEQARAEEQARVEAALKEEKEHRKQLEREKQQQKAERKKQQQEQQQRDFQERQARQIAEAQQRKQQQAKQQQAKQQQQQQQRAAVASRAGGNGNLSKGWNQAAAPPPQHREMTHQEQHADFEAERKRLQQERLRAIVESRQQAAGPTYDEEEIPAWDQPSHPTSISDFDQPPTFVPDPPPPGPAANLWGSDGGGGGGASGWGGAPISPNSAAGRTDPFSTSPTDSGSLEGAGAGAGASGGGFGSASPLDSQLSSSGGGGGFFSSLYPFGGGGGGGSGGGSAVPTDDSLEPGGGDDIDGMFSDIAGLTSAGLLDEEEELTEDPAQSRSSLFNRGRSGSVGSIDTVSSASDDDDTSGSGSGGLGPPSLGTTLWG